MGFFPTSTIFRAIIHPLNSMHHLMNPARETPSSDEAPSIPNDGGSNAALVSALRRLLRPLLKLLLAKGVTYPFLANLLKEVYVEVATADFRITGKVQTDSRISLLTGVHRKDVRRLTRTSSAETTPPNISLGGRLIARWCGDPKYLDERGQPLALPRQSTTLGNASFDHLVAAESTDIRARAVLDEWLRLGIVEQDPDNRIRLIASAFVPKKGSEEKAYFLGRNLHDHIAASAHNMLDQQPPFLERSVYYAQLSPSAVAELSQMSERMGMEALLAINRRARELKSETRAEDPGPRKRMTFGIYFFDATDETGSEGQ